MADVFTKAKRSEIMSRIRSKNTAIENRIFSYLRKNGIYFQKHYKKAPGNPDIALPRKKKAVFVDGDFWHGWRFNERKNKLPKVYWREKIEKNIARDKKNMRKLKNEGWSILRIWEHQLKKDKIHYLEKIRDFLIKY